MVKSPSQRAKAIVVLSAALLLFAAAQFAIRSPLRRCNIAFWDYSTGYSATRVWLAGRNPYDMNEVRRAWRDSKPAWPLAGTDAKLLDTWASLQLPSTFIVLSPIAMMRAAPAAICWLGLSIALFALRFPALFSLGKITDWSSRLLLVAAMLALAPQEVELETGQLSLPAVTLVILAIWAISKNRLTLGGVFLGFAAAFKPQIAAPFALLYLCCRQWRACIWALVVFAAITAAGVIRLEMAGVNWLADLSRNISATVGPGGINDPRLGGPWRHSRVDLSPLLFSFIGDPRAVIVIVASITGVLGAFAVRGIKHTDDPRKDLLCISVVAVIGLLPLYHRLYDASLLALPLTWAVAALFTAQYRSAEVILVVLSLFLARLNLLSAVLLRTRHLDHILQTRAGEALITSEYCWGLVVVAVALVIVLTHREAGQFREGSHLSAESRRSCR